MPRPRISKPTSLRVRPCFFCFEQRLAADEIALIEFDDPAEVGFERA